jgi:hypothetical protein
MGEGGTYDGEADSTANGAASHGGIVVCLLFLLGENLHGKL